MTVASAGAVDRARVAARLVRYVAIPSVNPAIDGGPGEAALADAVCADLAEVGLDPVREPVADGGRDNVVARLPGAPDAPLVMFHAHMDTVGISGSATTEAVERDGRVYGRGACDTKGSLVAALEAVTALRSVPAERRASVLLVAGVDEEVGATGAEAIVRSHPEIDMAVVGEPTGLETVTAHKGVLRFEIRTTGVSAHSSKPHLGVNAIHRMARVIEALETRYLPDLDRRRHPLVGSPTLNVSTIRGGSGLNVVPAACVIALDRRLVPGEDPEEVLAGFDALLEEVRAEGVVVERSEPMLLTSPLDTPPEHPLVRALGRARRAVAGRPGQPVGVTFGTDASILAPAGIPCVVFGPGSIDQAHSDEEWVSVEETAQAAEILTRLALELAG